MRATILILLLGALAGCGGLPTVYKINIEQGNVVTGEMLSDLEPGMTRSQVRYVLGTPLLENSFNRDRWDYIYTLRRGGKTLRQERLTVFFEDDKLTHFTGTLVPRPRQTPPTAPAKAKGAADAGEAATGEGDKKAPRGGIPDIGGGAEDGAPGDLDALVEALRTGEPLPEGAGASPPEAKAKAKAEAKGGNAPAGGGASEAPPAEKAE